MLVNTTLLVNTSLLVALSEVCVSIQHCITEAVGEVMLLTKLSPSYLTAAPFAFNS